MSQKLAFKWLGPYQIRDSVKNKDTYMLEELDGSRLADTFAGDKLKKFHSWQQLQLDHAPDLNNEEIPTLDKFLAGNSDTDLSEASNNFPDYGMSFFPSCTQAVKLTGMASRLDFLFSFLVFLFLVLGNNTSVGGDACDGVRSVSLKAHA